MSALQTSLYLVAVALCLFCTSLTTRGARGMPLKFFTGYLLIQSAAFLFELLIAHPAAPLKSLWLALLMTASLCVAPTLWLAFQEIVGGVRPRLRELPRGHWLAVGAGFAFTLPLMFSAHLGTTFSNPLQPASAAYSRVIHATMLLCIGVFAVQVPWYLVRCRRILVERIGPAGSHWAQLPLAIVLTTWALGILRTLDCAFIKWPPQFTLVVALISVSVTVGALYLLLRRFTPPEKRAAERYARSQLGAAVRARIRRKLECEFDERAIYKRSDLSLKALAEALHENPHYVSQVISQEFDTSFYELVNLHRIEHAKRMLRAAPHETVLAIAMDSGFNSKSAFHAAFRRSTGTTPTGFKSKAGESSGPVS